MNGGGRLAIALLVVAVQGPVLAGAQTITGTVRDAETGEILENATVMVVDKQEYYREPQWAPAEFSIAGTP